MDCWPQVTHTHTKNHPTGLTKWTDSTLRWRSTAYENSWKSECFLNGACSLRYNKNHYKNKSLTSFWHGPWNECTTDVMHCSLKKGSSKLTTNLHSTSGMSVCPVRKHAVQVKVSIDAPERQQPPPPPKKIDFQLVASFLVTSEETRWYNKRSRQGCRRSSTLQQDLLLYAMTNRWSKPLTWPLEDYSCTCF